MDENSCCSIAQGSHRAELIIKFDIIVLYEAHMDHKSVFEVVDRTFRKLKLCWILVEKQKEKKNPRMSLWSGSFRRWFRRILPLVIEGKKEDTVAASINKSYTGNIVSISSYNKYRLNTPSFEQLSMFEDPRCWW